MKRLLGNIGMMAVKVIERLYQWIFLGCKYWGSKVLKESSYPHRFDCQKLKGSAIEGRTPCVVDR